MRNDIDINYIACYKIKNKKLIDVDDNFTKNDKLVFIVPLDVTGDDNFVGLIDGYVFSLYKNSCILKIPENNYWFLLDDIIDSLVSSNSVNIDFHPDSSIGIFDDVKYYNYLDLVIDNFNPGRVFVPDKIYTTFMDFFNYLSRDLKINNPKLIIKKKRVKPEHFIICEKTRRVKHLDGLIYYDFDNDYSVKYLLSKSMRHLSFDDIKSYWHTNEQNRRLL